MKKALLLMPLMLFAKVYTVKIEPFMIYHYKAAASGQVVWSKIEKESKSVKDEQLIKIDDTIDRVNLKSLQKRAKILQRLIAIAKENLQNAKETYAIKWQNYQSIKDLKTKSRFEKNLRHSEALLAKQSLLAAKEKLQNLLMQQSDIDVQIKKLQDLIQKKNPKFSGYIYKIYPTKGDFVGIGAPLVDIADITKAKIVLYLSQEEIENIDKKRLFIDGKPHKLQFYKLQKITDSNYLTQYKAEIILPAPKIFGKFIKVEIK